MLRYFPQSYEKFKPLHLVADEYEPLECDSCGKDLLMDLFKGEYTANLARVEKRDPATGKLHIHDVYCACKGECDRKLQLAAYQAGYLAPWTDISDLVIPIEFLRYMFATMNRIRDGMDIYSDQAYSKEKKILIKIAQKVLRFTTEKERARFKKLRDLPF
jgi:hypothetical protein